MSRFSEFSMIALVSTVLLANGCGKNATENATPSNLSEAIGPIDSDGKFEQTLVEIDKLIGNRATSTKTSAGVGATYRLTGPIDKVVSVLDAYAKNAGFAAEQSPEPQVSQAMPSNSVVKVGKVYKHPNGDFLTMVHVEATAGSASTTLLSIQLRSPSRMVAH